MQGRGETLLHAHLFILSSLQASYCPRYGEGWRPVGTEDHFVTRSQLPLSHFALKRCLMLPSLLFSLDPELLFLCWQEDVWQGWGGFTSRSLSQQKPPHPMGVQHGEQSHSTCLSSQSRTSGPPAFHLARSVWWWSSQGIGERNSFWTHITTA